MAGQQPNRPIKGDKCYAHYISIDGSIEIGDKITEDEWWNTFIQFIESQDWTFGGVTKYEIEEMDYDPDHNPEAPIDEEELIRKWAITQEEYRQEKIKDTTEYLANQGFKVVKA